MDKSLLLILPGFCINPVLADAIRRAKQPKVNDIYKSSPLLRYYNVAGIKVEKVPYILEGKA